MAGPTSQQDKMAVHNSVDQKGDALSKADGTWEEMNQGYGKPLSKTRSFESQSKKKSGFHITGIIDRSRDRVFQTAEDADSVDDLDDTCETRTEDVSSDILDLSKNTDIEADPSSSEETTPSFMTEEVPHKDLIAAAVNNTNSNSAAVKLPQQQQQQQPPPIAAAVPSQDDKLTANPAVASGTADMQSRFKVVKIESKEPFRRGRWTCLDYLDPANVLEKPVERTVEEEGSGTSSASSSVQYAEQELDPGPMPSMAENQMVMDPTVYSQSQLPNGVEYSSYNPSLIQQGAGTQMSMPAQGQDSTVSQSFDTGASLTSTQQQQQPQVLASKPMNASQSNVSQSQQQTINVAATSIPSNTSSMPAASTPAPTPAEFQAAPSSVSQSQTGMNTAYDNSQVAGEPVPQQVQDVSQPSQVVSSSSQAQQNILDYQSSIGAAAAAAASSASATDIQGSTTQAEVGEAVFMPQSHDDGRPIETHSAETIQTNPAETSTEAEGAVGLAKSSVGILTSSALTNQSFLSPPLLEMVSGTAQQANPSGKEDGEGERYVPFLISGMQNGGASTVAIDNKIEQAMDLVKSHLMFAVREEVEVLKEQIKELLEKNNQLEYEINILKSSASPETLQKLAQVNQTSQQQQQPPTTSS